jgi:phytoene dehydrogenase-like protein
MTGGELLPATAWEQAAIIGIFIVFAIFVFGWLAKSRKEDRQFQAEESDKWQKFIGEIDDKWRAFNKEQRVENNDSLKCVENSLKDLTTVTQGLVSEVKEMRSDTSVFFENFHQHDAQAQEILDLVKKPAAKPRAKKVDVPTA